MMIFGSGTFAASLLAAALLCLIATASGEVFPCNSASFVDSFSNLPPAPAFPTTPYSQNPAIVLSNMVQNHFSERAVMARPEIRQTADGSRLNCPYLEAGLKNWHDPATWPGNALPSANADVSIPANTKVLISSCSIDPSVVYGIVTVPAGSELIFSDADYSIQARGFRVNGALRLGSPTCRLRSKITITLVGTRGAQALPTNEWIKGIYVPGEVDIHGAQYTPTWTRLASTLEVNSTVLFVQDLVNWQVGQKIFVTTTELKDSRDFNHNSELTITGLERINDRLTAIRFTPPSPFKHYGGREYQAEVGLISRNIVIQGDAAGSPPTDTVATCRDPTGNSTHPCNNQFLTGFGAHIMVTGDLGRFSGLQVYRGGQTNVLARYPIHFHMMGVQTNENAYIRDCNVYESYFRCFAIHGTHGTLVTENTVYNAIGHCYFIEDGVEENNTLSYNLGAHVHTLGPVQNPSLGISANGGGQWWSQELSFIDESATLVLPSDLSASVFYVTNPANYFLGNAASGGWAGYGFPALRNAVKVHEFKANNTTPKDRPLLLFKGNTAHSTGFYWGSAAGLYVGGELLHKWPGGPLTYTAGRVVSATRDTCAVDPKKSGGYCPADKQLWHRIEDFKVFLVNGRGIQHWGNRAEFVRVETWDCSLSMNVFGAVFIDDNLNVCRSGTHLPTFLSGCPTAPRVVPQNPSSSYNCNTRDRYFFQAHTSFQFYDVGQRHFLRNVEFRNCNSQFKPCYWGCEGGSVWSLLSHSSQFVPELMQATTQIKYTNCDIEENLWKFSTNLVAANGPTVSGKIQAWYDVDGSASLTNRRTMLGSARAGNWWKYNDLCFIKDEMWVCPLAPQDSAASLVFRGTHPNETQIGNTQCLNGEELYPRACSIVARITPFGRNEATHALDVGLNAKVTGPIIAQSGGWFVRFNAEPAMGTPRVLTIQQIQVQPDDILLLGIPYPANTQFQIQAKAATWCNSRWNECEKNFTKVDTLDEVRFGDGTKYLFQNQVLFIRVVYQVEGSFGSKGAVWTVPQDPPQFSRAGMSLLYTSDQYKIVIRATGTDCTGFACQQAASAVVQIPSSLGPAPVCMFAKPDWQLKCAFTQVQIELIIEFFFWVIVCLALWRRTEVLSPLRLGVIALSDLNKSATTAVSFCLVSLLGLIWVACSADFVAVQVGCGMVLVMFAVTVAKLDEQSKRGMVYLSFAAHVLAIALCFVISYLTVFTALRLYLMLPAVLFTLHPVWMLAAFLQTGGKMSRGLTTALASPEPDMGKQPSTSSSSSSLASSTIYSTRGEMVMYSFAALLIAAAGMYIAFVVATLY